MGLLSLGTPLSWDKASEYSRYVRQHGIQQFISIYHRLKDKTNDRLLWGDEIEYMVVSFDQESKNATIAVDLEAVLEALMNEEALALKNPK